MCIIIVDKKRLGEGEYLVKEKSLVPFSFISMCIHNKKYLQRCESGLTWMYLRVLYDPLF